MGLGIAIPFVVVTAFWGLFGGVGPLVVPKGPNRGIVQVMLVMTAVCCYIFWICTFIAQLNPLIGPVLKNSTLYILKNEWR